MTLTRRSSSAEAAAQAERERIAKMSPRERILLALRLGQRARALQRRDVRDHD